MSLSVESPRVIYNANGVLTSFAITQTFFSNNDNIKVYVVDEGVDPIDEDLQIEGTDYSISGSNVVFVSAPANGLKVLIERELDIEQELDLISSGPLNVDSLEEQMDKIVAIAQQLNLLISRAVKVRRSSTLLNLELPEPVANFLIRFNSAADGLEAVDPTSAGISGQYVDAFGETPSGVINSSNTAFTLANEPVAGTFRLYKNGRRITDYSLSSAALTLDDPAGYGAELLCDYKYVP